MNYDKLSKFFYKHGSECYYDELKKRKTSYSSYLTNLNIKGFQKGRLINEDYTLFYVNIHRLAYLNNRVHVNSLRISSLIDKLPKFIVEPYFHKLIINEAQSNNEIEGVRSTKRELKEALTSQSKKKRFKGLMNAYSSIDKIKPFSKASDFRDLYEKMVSDEIDKNSNPDGELFRKGYVEVNDGIETTHIGVSSETKIIECLDKLINFLNDDSHLELYRYMIAHYYYEYIHPFYDGNGRTGRLLLCSYLSRYLEKYSAITFSYAINKNKSKYYKALEEIPTKWNKGEVTFYLIEMLEFLSTGQEDVIDDLEINLFKLARIEKYFGDKNWENKKEQAKLLETLAYIRIFIGDDKDISSKELEKLFNKSRYKLNKITDELIDRGYIELTSKRPKKYRLSCEALKDITIMW